MDLVEFKLKYIISHVFLPPKLPQNYDTTTKAEVSLTRAFHEALNSFIGLLPEDVQDGWVKLPPMLSILLDDRDLKSPFASLDGNLRGMTEGDVLALHITQQNAGLVVRKTRQQYTIETFELSATTWAVMGTSGRLVRRFPGPVIALSDKRVRGRHFRKAFIQCLESLEADILDNASGTGCETHKDTVHPKFVTQWLSGILRGIGTPLEGTRIHKRTRDDVIWGGIKPWRRSPRWILLRVALQTTLAGPGSDHSRYKIFMIYFMATILEQAVQDEFPSHLVHVMLGKINRRIQKLRIFIPDDAPWADQPQNYVNETMESARKLLAQRWSTIQKSADSAGKFHPAELTNLKPYSDTLLSLSHLRPFLEQLHNYQLPQRDEATFDGKCVPRINVRENSLPEPKTLQAALDPEVRLSLMDVEFWVSNSLNPWLNRHNKLEEDFEKLAKVISWYMSTSLAAYTKSPENFSVMMLTLMLLWVALDEAAVSYYPILKNFDPSFPPTLFESLLLPKRNQMVQLRDVEKYLLKRKANALKRNPSVFGDISSASAFGAQYFDQSANHKDLKAQIEKQATEEANAKKAELKDLKTTFTNMMAQSNRLQCTTIIANTHRGKNRHEVTEHDPNCLKCKLRGDAQALKISCFEWPLPKLESTAKSVVFELDIPKLVRIWRSTTYQILADVLNPFPLAQAKQKGITLAQYEGLRANLKSEADRLQLVSSTKSCAQKGPQYVFEATEYSVCPQNNLTFTMRDSKSQRATSDHLNKYNIHERCTMKLPRGCYETLQYAVDNTKHTPNEVISRQVTCPDGLTVHEFHAFTILRSGNRIQWLNIARELVSRTLDFGKEEVSILLLQASWQAGPSALQQVSRDSHIDLEEEGFGHNLLCALEEGLTSILSNWQGSVAALSFSSLAARLLSISLHECVRDRCLRFLQKARVVTIEWLRVVVSLLHNSSDEEEITYLTLRALDLALICHNTFDIDPCLLPSILSSADNVAILIEAAIAINDRWPVSEEPLAMLTRELMRRFHRTSHSLEPTLKQHIINSPDGINKAIRQIWAGYESETPWVMLEAPNDRWLTTRTISSMIVHFNTLTGSFLSNGCPLGRLPREYESHPTYERLFGDKILEVIPSSMGLHFETRNLVHGFRVHFALHDMELTIRACHGDDLYEVIPTHVLKEDFPHTLVQNYIHWIHRGTMVIEWRPLESKWIPSADNWRIMTPEDHAASRLVLRTRFLVDPGSKTAESIYQWLKPLEISININIYYNEETWETEIRLPRMNLDFILRKNGLESKQFRGMLVDNIQKIGTLHGLLHKLVLKDSQGPSKIVLIPHGAVSYNPIKHHIQVSISTEHDDKISYHQYVIDKDLGLLRDNGNLRSRFFKLYLHALTSHCLPDTLTSRTGTEEALHGLRLAATRSFLSLDLEHIEQLKLFAELTPSRNFFPSGSKFMHTVKWDAGLSPLSHHECFAREAHLIFAQAESFQELQKPADMKYKLNKRGSYELGERAAIRNAFFRVHSFGAEKFTLSYDRTYEKARDAISDCSHELEACYIATTVDKWSYRLDPYVDLFLQIKKCDSHFYGARPNFEFKFDKKCLEPPSKFLAENWCTLQKFLSSSDATKDKFGLTVVLASLAQSKSDNLRLVHTLLAFATAPGLRNLQPPEPPASGYFDISNGFKPNKDTLGDILDRCKVPLERSPEIEFVQLPDESRQDHLKRREAAYHSATKFQADKCLEGLMLQWPTKDIIRPRTPDIETYLPGLKTNFQDIRDLFSTWHKNLEFKTYIQEIQVVLDSLPLASPMPKHYRIPAQMDTYQSKSAYLMIGDLLQNQAPEFAPPQDELQELLATRDQPAGDKRPSKLKSLLTKLSKSAHGYYQDIYIRDLQKSHKAFLANSLDQPHLISGPPCGALKNHLTECKGKVESMYKTIYSRLVVYNSPVYNSARRASMLPRLSPSIVLGLLSQFNPVALSAEWKNALIRYALAFASMQRAARLVACGERDSDIVSELANKGHTNWNPMEFPEWLLLELESNLLIRPEQAQIAREMIAPQSGSNSIMQLNMGLGKSSVIVPIVAATLADRSKLVRVVVLKSLSEQMFQLLVSKLGGLIGRRIYRLPINRALAPSLHCAHLIQRTYTECMAGGGILLIEPESLLSFELLGIDYLLSRDLNPPGIEANLAPDPTNKPPEDPHEIGKVMVQTQQWLNQYTRDVLDESDEVLSVRNELIYTLGIQQNIQFSPDRWCIIGHVLGILSETAREASAQFPQGLEVLEGSTGAFPRIRILQETAGKIILDKVAESLCRSGMPSMATWTFSDEERKVICEFITNTHLPKARAAILETKVLQTDFTRMTLLLLRGLFAAGVLEFVFSKKRYRVNYGLDPSRSMLAVPYDAKDNPSARSEFSHPDTAIALTCLSYYYGGLTDQQIHASFEELLASDHPQEDYVQWIKYCDDLPKPFKYLTGVNLRDKQQCLQELFPSLRYSKGLIDYYLQHLVFPKQMKEFSNKLSSSGWEIARKKNHPTTGFSGTNDSKFLLPLSTQQCELSEQLSTNAEVLASLLQPENTYDTEFTPGLETIDVTALLGVAITMQPPVRVILDVGAQLLDDNQKIATSWLGRVTAEDAQAVVYFQDDDIFVVNREGLKESLLVSPYAKQIDQCLVYLDEAHTRGTDLKMPADYRAIVTLGPDLTKDRLAQACKRLRKLGKGQSVVFCAPPEVQSKILECCGKNDVKLIEVGDVLLWAMRNSWDFTKKAMPLWATQGMRHYRRRAAFDLSAENPRISVGILEPEALTLEERYGLDRENLNEGIVCRNRIQVETDVTRAEVCSIRLKCRDFGLHSFGHSDLHEEQERELQPENEREQQVEPPVPTLPYKHMVHVNIRNLVLTGALNSHDGLLQAFKVFRLTRAIDKLNIDDWPKTLLASEDFAHTVQIPKEGNKDSFLRPVNWILSFVHGENRQRYYLVLSPFEVQELLPYMRGQNRVRLHIYAPRLSLSNRTLEELSFCAVPAVPSDWSIPAISTALNLFAGQLYIRDAREYRKICRFLGVRFQESYVGVDISTDGFISPETRHLQDETMANICNISRSPIEFLRLVTTFRRLGQTFSNSHMGKLLRGELVRAMDFDVVEPIEEIDADDLMDVDEQTITVKWEPGLFVD